MDRARAGDLDAYEVLVVRHTPAAHRAAVLLGAGAEADDVVQEALVKAYRQLARHRGDTGFRPWLLAIVANETRNLHRSRRRQDGLVLRAAGILGDGGSRDGGSRGGGSRDGFRGSGALPGGPRTGAAEPVDPADSAVAVDRRQRLLDHLRSLPPADREVLVCRYFLDLSEAETATTLNLPKGTVKSRTARALRKLRAKVGEAADA